MSKKQSSQQQPAERMTRRQIAKVFQGVIAAGAQRLGPGPVRAAWAVIYESSGGEPVAFEQFGELDEQQRGSLKEFVRYASAVIGACHECAEANDVKAAMAFFAEQEQIWQLLGKESE